jgi:hypothetical protein
VEEVDVVLVDDLPPPQPRVSVPAAMQRAKSLETGTETSAPLARPIDVFIGSTLLSGVSL